MLSGAAGALPGYVTLWVLFAVLALLLERAYRLHGPGAVLRALLAAFALPLGMQALSLAAGLPKVGPDGSLSYIGGYAHESVFAIVALGALWTAAMLPWPDRRLAWLAVAVGLAALVLANYRTMLIAALPLVAAFAVFDGAGRGGRVLPRVLALGALCLIVLPAVVPPALVARFAELGTLAGDWNRFVKPPEFFTAADRDVLSARVYIWAVYAAAVGQADLPHLMLGHGAEALAPGMTTHPHNDYLRVAYQHGLIGAVGLFGLLVTLAIAAARAAPRRAGVLTAAGFAGVLIAAMGTSLFDRPEGMIVLAILTATAWTLGGQRQPLSVTA
jgi:O-antigen ligase